jgi:actin-binding protein IPP
MNSILFYFAFKLLMDFEVKVYIKLVYWIFPGIFKFADKHSCIDLKEAAETYIHNHFLSVIKEEEFLSLSKETLVYILESELLNIDNEYQVFNAAMHWIFHCLKERRRYVFEVLLPVRFAIISPKLLDKYVMECSDLSLKIAIMKLLDDFRTKRAEFGLARYRMSHIQPRKSARKRIYVIGGYCRPPGGKWMDSLTLDSVDCFDLFHQEWMPQTSLHIARSSHGAVTLNGQIYVVGGESNSLIFDSAESFDPSSSKWTMIPSMTEPRCGVGVCMLEDTIYAIGGCIGLEIGKSVEMFDPNCNIWRQVDYIRFPRLAMGLAEVEGKLLDSQNM